ncbi:MAG: tRNA (adenosine(37)-N6)-dimethylallyltransferase MiaA [Clostridia bacterium]|nr:tRNA (adenosine(37)-N6)-dimethylallyltransferase MiaA [Clostridia bacterium]
MLPLLVIGGPTASGKTALAVGLAKRLDGEVVSADSMQIYKYMDIGSAKPDEEEKEGVVHHLMDVAEPTENFSLGDYLNIARDIIADIHARGKLPIVTGGTGLYINSLIDNVELSEEENTSEIRKKLTEFAEKNGSAALYERLGEIDPESAERIHPNNVKRVMRALEIFEATGKTMTESLKESKKPPVYKAVQYGIDYPREELYDRINRRVDIMLGNGLIEEVRKLVEMGCTRQHTAMQGIGYKEVLDHLEGKTDRDEMAEAIKQATRRYAKRQITWFKRNNMIWLDPKEIDLDRLSEETKLLLKE